MAYGSPDNVNDVPEYLKHIYEGRPVPDYAMKENMEKYRMHGGKSPSNRIIENISKKLKETLNDEYSVHLAFKHWHPFLSEVAPLLKHENPEEIIAVPLFPFPSRNVEKSYLEPLYHALADSDIKAPTAFINGFTGPALESIWTDILAEAQMDLSDTALLFDAHSLPTFRGPEPEYDSSFRKTSEGIAGQIGADAYFLGYQSIGKYGNSWLGPSLYDVLPDIQSHGYSRILAVPVGFIYEHLEVLYDLDYEFGMHARSRGVDYRRSGLPNDRDKFIKLLHDIILSGGEGTS
ncbi:ferrochelatase [Thermoplasmatales archaeon AK]|nr:ferrochelatase [Thermoplasmatales archaeon AK]